MESFRYVCSFGPSCPLFNLHLFICFNFYLYFYAQIDALTLRKNYRIIGAFIGPWPGHSHQVQENGIPLQLLPEEAKLLLGLGVCKLVRYKCNFRSEMAFFYQNYRSSLLHDYEQLLKGHREESTPNFVQLNQKRQKISQDNDISDQETIKDTKTNASSASFDVTDDTLPVEMFVQSKWAERESVYVEDWNYPSNEEEMIKCAIFKDIWEKGFFLTNGFKFGCDYLVYKNDPLKTHADYMIICKTSQEDISSLQLLILSRLSTQVRKKLLIAVVPSEDCKSEVNLNTHIVYLLVKWAGNQDSVRSKMIMQPHQINLHSKLPV